MIRTADRLWPTLLALFFICCAQPVFCQTGTEPTGFTGEGELGYLMTSGNTETQSLNARLGIMHETERWQNKLESEAVYGSEESQETGEDVTTNQRFLVSGKSSYRFDRRNSAFGLAVYDDDRFSGFKYQLTFSAGYNRQIIDSESMSWEAEIGPGYRYNKLEDDEATDTDEGEAIVHAGTLFAWAISDSATFTEDISVDSGADNTITRSATSLKLKINDRLSTKISFHLKHTSDVPPEKDKTDTETALTLVYGF
ncbi:MAG: DUF481 domain-containing protein [Thermodesulfobacteriota bacterium]